MDFKTLDTETNKGKAFLACMSDGKSEEDFHIKTRKDAERFFVELQRSTKVAFAYNLDYDNSALIKWFGQQVIIDFYVEKPIVFEYEGEKYEISGFPRKFIKVSKLTTVKSPKRLTQREEGWIRRKLLNTELKGQEKEFQISYSNEIIELLNSLISGKRTLKDTYAGTNIKDCLSDIKLDEFAEKKVAAVREKISRETTFVYDICQYYDYMPLWKSSKKYLGETKDDIPDKWKKNMLKYFKNPKNRIKIIKYCRKDCRLTHKLVAHFIKMLIDAGVIKEDKVNKARYYSSGYIAKKFINKKAKVMAFYDEEVNAFMKNFCFGGRIEVARRGYFDNVYLNDINSAYGSGLANLKSITSHSFTVRPDNNAPYFFADCEFYLPDNYIQPVPIKFNNWKYPYGKGRAVLDRRTFENVLKTGNILKVHKSLNVYADDHYPFRKIVYNLYNQRAKSESHKFIFKNLINSYIGKLNEKVRIRTYVGDEAEQQDMIMWVNDWNQAQQNFESHISICGCQCYLKGKVDPRCRCITCMEWRNKYAAVKQPPNLYWMGDNMFYTEEKLKYKTHPLYNALVVSGMRNSMYEEGLKLGDNLIGFFTDAIFTKVPMQNTSSKLGGFSEKYKGWLYLVGAGVYETAEGTKLRGYNSEISLLEYANKFKKDNVMETPSLERVGMGRAVGTLNSFTQFNELKETFKTMKVNFDSNRQWERQFENYAESLKTNINSQPIKL